MIRFWVACGIVSGCWLVRCWSGWFRFFGVLVVSWVLGVWMVSRYCGVDALLMVDWRFDLHCWGGLELIVAALLDW